MLIIRCTIHTIRAYIVSDMYLTSCTEPIRQCCKIDSIASKRIFPTAIKYISSIFKAYIMPLNSDRGCTNFAHIDNVAWSISISINSF